MSRTDRRSAVACSVNACPERTSSSIVASSRPYMSCRAVGVGPAAVPGSRVVGPTPAWERRFMTLPPRGYGRPVRRVRRAGSGAWGSCLLPLSCWCEEGGEPVEDVGGGVVGGLVAVHA